MNLLGGERNFVIVRQGSIARIRDVYSKPQKGFLLDTFIFPGNSGGPVILKPEIASIQGTKPINRSHLVGIVSGYLPYIDVAVSLQTKRARVSFEENSGLAQVVPVDYIDEVIKDYEASPSARRKGCQGSQAK